MLNKNRLMAFVALITLMAPVAVGCGKKTSRIVGGTQATVLADCGANLPGEIITGGVSLNNEGDMYYFMWSDDKYNVRSYKVFLCDQDSKQRVDYITVTRQPDQSFRAVYTADGQEIVGAVAAHHGQIGILDFEIPDTRNANVETLTPYIVAISSL